MKPQSLAGFQREFLKCTVPVGYQRLGMGKQSVTLIRKLDVAAIPDKQRYAQVRFELFDASRDCRRGQVKIVSSLAEMTSLVDLKEGLEQIDVHVSVDDFNFSLCELMV